MRRQPLRARPLERQCCRRWTGFFVDFCRASPATLKSASAVEFVELNQRTRFDATGMRSRPVQRQYDLDTDRDASMGLQFAATLYYDGQGFIAPTSLSARKLKDLKQASVCVTATQRPKAIWRNTSRSTGSTSRSQRSPRTTRR